MPQFHLRLAALTAVFLALSLVACKNTGSSAPQQSTTMAPGCDACGGGGGGGGSM